MEEDFGEAKVRRAEGGLGIEESLAALKWFSLYMSECKRGEWDGVKRREGGRPHHLPSNLAVCVKGFSSEEMKGR